MAIGWGGGAVLGLTLVRSGRWTASEQAAAEEAWDLDQAFTLNAHGLPGHRGCTHIGDPGPCGCLCHREV